MKAFLEYVAHDIIKKHGYDLSRIAVVFPNKRASLFFNEYLAKIAGKPIWSPAYVTISDFFQAHSNLKIADPIKLVCDLYKCFVSCTNTSETLDHFYSWGQLLLSDFDDIDKNLVDARKVFANVTDLHEFDDTSYLTKEQILIIKKFFSNFSENHNSELKKRFISLWSHIYDIYESFNSVLKTEGLAYEGALYRQVAEKDNINLQYDTYIFVGFNMLQKVETKLFTKLKKDGRARFYWDIDKYYVSIKGGYTHEAGRYIQTYLDSFPNELDTDNDTIYNNFSSPKDITCISASTENMQARYVNTWLNENTHSTDGKRSAIVLCDENLLLPVVYSLPCLPDSVNITAGYPLIHSPLTSFISLLISLQTSGYVRQSDKYRLNHVNHILKHPLIAYISGFSKDLYLSLNGEVKVYYPDRTILSIDEGTSILFCSLDEKNDIPFTGRLINWIIRIIKHIASTVRNSDSDQLFQESLFRMYTLMNRFSDLILSGDLNVDVITLQRLINQVIKSTTIPFHGEPIAGIQIMGVLETRNLDFDNLLILSANEGNMPKGVNDASFIPYNIRKAYELTTIDNKVAIYSYYFYRLLQRAKDITVIYNNSTESTTRSELSRFMLQIIVESGHTVKRKTLQGGSAPMVFQPSPIKKTAEIMHSLLMRFAKSANIEIGTTIPLLTPTAINRYMRCPKIFFYNYVCGIKEPEEDNECTIDNRTFGNIFHSVSHKIYKHLTDKTDLITYNSIKSLMGNTRFIERVVDETFAEELFKTAPNAISVSSYNGIQLINRQVIITYIKKLLKIDMNLAPFKIIGLEMDAIEEWEVNTDKLSFTTTIGGRIDRIDCINDEHGERIRVIDYKTSSKNIGQLDNVEAIFDPNNISKHSDYYLQAFLYSRIIKNSTHINNRNIPVSPALLFIQHASKEVYDPTLCIAKEPVVDIENLNASFEQLMRQKINEIFDSSVPFVATKNREHCQICPYYILCSS